MQPQPTNAMDKLGSVTGSAAPAMQSQDIMGKIGGMGGGSPSAQGGFGGLGQVANPNLGGGGGLSQGMIQDPMQSFVSSIFNGTG
jgi:hypothetical protein